MSRVNINQMLNKIVFFLFAVMFSWSFGQEKTYEVKKMKNGAVIVLQNGKYGLMFKKKIVVTPAYASFIESRGYVCFYEENTETAYAHLYAKNGNVIIKDNRFTEFEWMDSLILGYTNHNSYAVFDRFGKCLVPEGIFEIEVQPLEKTFTKFNWDSTALLTYTGETLIPMGVQSIFPADYTEGVFLMVRNDTTHFYFKSNDPLANGMVKLNEWEFGFTKPVTIGEYLTMVQDVRMNGLIAHNAKVEINWKDLLPSTDQPAFQKVLTDLESLLSAEEPQLLYKTELCPEKKKCWTVFLAYPVSAKSNDIMKQPIHGLNSEQQKMYAEWLSAQYRSNSYDEILSGAAFEVRKDTSEVEIVGFYLKARFYRD